MDKHKIAQILDEIGVFLELKGENVFKTRAYQSASRTLETLEEDLAELIKNKSLDSIKGIGKAIAEKIEHLYTEGSLPYYDELKDSIPPGLIEMLSIPGLGPKKIKAIYDKLGIETISELEQACKEGKIAELAGFGKKSEEKILLGIQNREVYSQRILWAEANKMAEPILQGLKKLKAVEKVELAGSLRRNLETVGDLDFIVAAEDPKPIMDWFTSLDGIQEVSAKGDTKSSVRLAGGVQADLRVVPLEQFYFALHHFTGSKEHNIKMRQRALDQGLSLSEWGLRPEKGSQDLTPIKIKSEADLFKTLGLNYIPPELREGDVELEFSEKNKLPHLVELKDIKGSFHNHTTASDGKASLLDMAKGAEALGWKYLGIADHSKSSFQANGLSEDRLLTQIAEIKKFNENKKSSVYIFSGTECDILRDGKLDFSDSILEQLDYVVVSVHSSFTLSEEDMTKRIIKALENPFSTMLGHLTGRLLLRREPYAVNIKKVIDAAIANKKVIELNANPMRLDMDWRFWRKAVEKGLICSINPDAHSVEGLSFVENGVRIARKGWLTQESILNCWTLKQVRNYLCLD